MVRDGPGHAGALAGWLKSLVPASVL